MVYNIGPGKPSAASAALPAEKTLKKVPLQDKAGALSFKELLQGVQKEQELKISAHARQRMESRQIYLNEADLRQISDAVDRAESKGARSSLLLFGDVALVASISNKTIITAIDDVEAQEHIFTGIDSAVIVK